ncbi:hypothetical protein CTZ27_37020 [Streptomyces griseocarneus]|nr:hypothetical protein CTZ27_37020 [Streptomyces griseocarneus]
MTDTNPAPWPLSLRDPVRAVHFTLEPHCPYRIPGHCPREAEARMAVDTYRAWLSAHQSPHARDLADPETSR